jgi:DNA-binding response OmpR family regulator
MYIAVRNQDYRSQIDNTMALDGINTSSFSTAQELWAAFLQKPVRFVITERRFGDDFDGLSLCRKIRKRPPLPYIYLVMLSTLSRLEHVKEGLATGVDDYLIKPPNPLQIRLRVLVGLRWLQHIDNINSQRLDIE